MNKPSTSSQQYISEEVLFIEERENLELQIENLENILF